MADRRQLAEEIAAGLARGGLTGLSKADIYHRFQDSGVSRAGIYRAIDDALRLAAERGTPTPAPEEGIAIIATPRADAPPVEGIPITENQIPDTIPAQGASVTKAPADTMLAIGPLTAAFGELERAMGQLHRDGAMLPSSIAGIRQALERIHAAAGPGDLAGQLTAAVIDSMRHGGPAFGARMASVFRSVGG